jgi:trehalose utilization protein
MPRISHCHSRAAGHEVRVATYAEPNHGMTPKVLDGTEVLVYWDTILIIISDIELLV